MSAKAKKHRGLPPDLVESALDLNSLREKYRVELLFNILDSIQGTKCLVIEESLGGPLNHVLVHGSKELKEHNVHDFKELNWADLHTECSEVVYIIRPNPKSVKQMASQLLSFYNSKSRHISHAYFVPQRSQLCEQLLKDLKVDSILKDRIKEFHMGLIPFDTDVLSMEVDSTMKDCVLHGDCSSLVHCARALVQLQDITGGAVENIQVSYNYNRLE